MDKKTVAVMMAVSFFIVSAAPKKPPVFRSTPLPPPIVNTNIVSPTERYGDWTVAEFGTKSYIATTTNPSGSLFGVVCGSTCTAVINPKIQCKDKQSIPALINSSAGSFSAQLTCLVIDGRYLFSTPVTKTFVDSMEIGGQLGIAFPMESGQFQVARFSLTGSLKAVLRAYDLSPASSAKQGEEGFRDQTL